MRKKERNRPKELKGEQTEEERQQENDVAGTKNERQDTKGQQNRPHVKTEEKSYLACVCQTRQIKKIQSIRRGPLEEEEYDHIRTNNQTDKRNR